MVSSENRRDFLKTAGAGFLTIPLLGLKGLEINAQEDDNRMSFYLNENLVYLNTGSLGPSPKWVVNRINELSKILESNPVSENWGELGSQMEHVREKAAVFLGCEKEEIVLTRNTTEGLSMVSSTLDLKAGDEILTTNHEHGGGEVGLDFKAVHGNVKIKKLELPFPVNNPEQVINAVMRNITSQTRLLMLSHVSTITGMILPMQEISGQIRDKDIFFLADGAQACGMIHVDIVKLGVDAYATSGHKWLLGPKETGLLYVRKGVQERIYPVFTHSGYGSYSASSGTRNVAQFITLGDVFDWHVNRGREKIEENSRQLAQYCYERLEALDGLTLISPKDPELRSAMISAIVLDKSNRDVYEYLKSKEIIVKVLPKYNALRFSTHIFNTTKDVDRLVTELNKYL